MNLPDIPMWVLITVGAIAIFVWELIKGVLSSVIGNLITPRAERALQSWRETLTQKWATLSVARAKKRIAKLKADLKEIELYAREPTAATNLVLHGVVSVVQRIVLWLNSILMALAFFFIQPDLISTFSNSLIAVLLLLSAITFFILGLHLDDISRQLLRLEFPEMFRSILEKQISELEQIVSRPDLS